jgi:HAMP domain-containing protein
MSSARNSHPWNRLHVQLALWHSALVFVIVSAVLVLSNVALRARVEEQDRDAVLFRLNQYASEYERGGLQGAMSLAALRKGRAQKAFFVRVASPTGQTLFTRDVEDWVEFSPESLQHSPPPQPGKVDWVSLPSDSGYPLLIAGIRSQDGAIIQVGRATEDSRMVFEQFRRITLVLLAVAIPVSIAGGAFIAGRVLRPLRALARTVREIDETARFSMRTPVNGSGDELDELARAWHASSGSSRPCGTPSTTSPTTCGRR